jgi:hypothetical protein
MVIWRSRDPGKIRCPKKALYLSTGGEFCLYTLVVLNVLWGGGGSRRSKEGKFA